MGFQKVRGKKIYCNGFGGYDFIQNTVTCFDGADMQEKFKGVSDVRHAAGIVIQPLSERQEHQRRNGKEITPEQDIQEDSIALLFYRAGEIDKMIGHLKECKDILKQKTRKQMADNYRAKYCGQIIRFEDILNKQSVEEKIAKYLSAEGDSLAKTF